MEILVRKGKAASFPNTLHSRLRRIITEEDEGKMSSTEEEPSTTSVSGPDDPILLLDCGGEDTMEPSMEYCLAQVLQKDVGKRLQVGQELIDYFSDKQKSADLEHDQTMLDKMVDGLATSWVNSSNYKVVLLGIDIISALVSRLQDRFKAQIGTVLPSLLDRLGDSKDSVREQDQTLLLKIMEQAANPQYVWDRMLGGFKHKNFRTREGICLCLIATLNASGAQSLTLSKIVPHICNLLGDPNSQVRDAAINSLVEIYRHVGERVRADLSKKGLPQSRWQAGQGSLCCWSPPHLDLLSSTTVCVKRALGGINVRDADCQHPKCLSEACIFLL
ncbi:hypothetical protein IHE44_0014567 [Lamprotornis superbus]|uniref:TOG domain-containing protein n=1 Tax=Lamprotornis superbus TaxID=245042 RepID=A0A835P193_9PASS|nr:hypothetical protein IHE44_0014567 [Lamprotornis superbus]